MERGQTNASTDREPQRLALPDLYPALGTSPEGLSADEARRRLARYGPNRLQEQRGPSLASRFLKQFTHFLAVLLWIAAVLALLAEALQPGQGMATLAWAIVGVIVINAFFSFMQEYKAERAVQALHRLLPETAWVVRAGQPQQVAREELVPGDVLLLEEGEQVPADARLVEAVSLRVDNSSLTGEATPAPRTAEPIMAADPIEAPNLVFAGTTVLSGHGRAIVYATGMATEFGRIARLAGTVEPGLSPLQHEIIKVTHVVAILSLVMGSLFFLIGILMGVGVWASAIFGIGIIVANVPEGLLPTVTLALALGSQRMARRKALIKQLTSVETLGCTTVICTDKTGTLTENRMRVERLYLGDTVLEVRGMHLLQDGRLLPLSERDRLTSLLRAIGLCHSVRPVRQGLQISFRGDPTEVALVEFAREHGRTPEALARLRKMGELPFDADRKRMSTIHWVEGKLVAYVKGAPESVLPLCNRALIRGAAIPLTPADRDRILAQAQKFANDAYRVLAVAMRDVRRETRQLDIVTVERDLTYLGLVALLDPPHPEVPEAVARCRQAGVGSS